MGKPANVKKKRGIERDLYAATIRTSKRQSNSSRSIIVTMRREAGQKGMGVTTARGEEI